MKPVILFLLSCFLASKGIAQTKGNHRTHTKKPPSFPYIAAVAHPLPLYLEGYKPYSTRPGIALNGEQVSAIKALILRFYIDDCGGGDGERGLKAKDVYMGTMRLRGGPDPVFLVLLKLMPANEVQGRLLFYDHHTNQFIKDQVDLKLFAMYDLQNGRLVASRLKGLFNIRGPEIAIAGFGKDGRPYYRVRRLFHNGTFNAIQTLVFQIKNQRVDTLSFERDGSIAMRLYGSR